MSLTFQLDREKAVAAIPEFLDLYSRKPITDNSGGMGFNHSFATWYMLRELQPSTVIESGVWKGHSTWLIERACPDAQLYPLDLNFSRLEYKSEKATYIQEDFARCDWSGIDPETTVGFFDDHQNAYARLKELWWVGIRHAIFEDNFPCGQGDCYSLRHVQAGYGHPHLQMSAGYRGG